MFGMRRKIVVLLLLLISTSPVGSVPLDSVGVKTIKGKKYIEHKVAEHEGWYGIARKYGIPYSDIRVANKDAGDTIHSGQVILVPMDKGKPTDPRNQKNYTQKTDQAKAIEKQRVFHKVKQKETLYSIGQKYKVTKEELKKWNKGISTKLVAGDSIVVGFKKAKSNQATVKPGNPALVRSAEEKKKIKEDSLKKSDAKVKEVTTVKVNPVIEKSPLKQEIPDTSSTGLKSDFAPNRKEMIEQGVGTWIDDENINPNKYFALHRIAPTGTIVKLTNRMNKRTVYVKVVGKLPDTGENENIIIKVSKASAEKLGVLDQRFQCDLSYGISAR